MSRNLLLWMLVVAPAAACADQPAGGPDTVKGPASAATSNQAAALDTPGNATDSPSPAGRAPNVGQQIAAGSPDDEAAIGVATDQMTPGAGQTPPPPVEPTSTPEEALQPGPAQPLPALGNREPIPWYRNGLLSLVIVLAVIGGVAYLVRRLVPSVRTFSGGAIEILGRQHLSPKQSLALVRVGQRMLLVGISAERLTTLCQIDQPEEVAELLVQAPNRRPPRGQGRTAQFDELLSDLAGDFAEPDRGLSETVPGRSERLDHARGRVQGLLSRLRALQQRQ